MSTDVQLAFVKLISNDFAIYDEREWDETPQLHLIADLFQFWNDLQMNWFNDSDAGWQLSRNNYVLPDYSFGLVWPPTSSFVENRPISVQEYRMPATK